MARQIIPIVVAPGPFGATAATIAFTASDATNFERALFTGKESIIWFNSGVTGRLCTVTSVALPPSNRTGNLTVTVAAGAYAIFGPLSLDGFRQSDGYIYFQAAHADMLVAVVQGL